MSSYKILRSIILDNTLEVKKVCEVGVYNVRYSNMLPFARQNENECKVMLVEPQPNLAWKLRQYAQTNGLESVKVYEVAAGDTKGISTFRVPQMGGASDSSGHLPLGGKDVFSIRQGGQKNLNYKEIEVPTVTFDVIDTAGDIDILSIDTEGAEWFAIKHMKSRPSLIMIEMLTEANDNLPRWVNPYYQEILEWMKQNKYSLVHRAPSDFFFQRDDTISEFKRNEVKKIPAVQES